MKEVMEETITQSTSWKEYLSGLPWTDHVFGEELSSYETDENKSYFDALEILASIELNTHSIEEQKRLLDVAVRLLLVVYEENELNTAVSFTLARALILNGNMEEASMVLETLLKLPTFDSIELPFLPPLRIHDKTGFHQDAKNWVMVRMIEGYLYLNRGSGQNSQKNIQLKNLIDGNSDSIILSTNHQRVSNTQFDFSKDEEGVFIHFCRNHIYGQVISDLVEFVNKISNQKHWLFIEQTTWKAGLESYSIDTSQNPHTLFFDCTQKSEMDKIYQTVLNDHVDAVIMHGLFRGWEFSLINNLGTRKHFGWMIWGGDLYKPIKKGNPAKIPVNKISSIHSTVDGDRELFIKTYGEKAFYKLRYPYPGLYGDSFSNSKKSCPRIIVGNSGDESNNHLEILEILQQKHDIKEYELVLPVAYNLKPEYEAELLEWIQNSDIKELVTLKREFLKPQEYMKFIDESQMLITAHQRQQSVGNMLMSIYTGKRTVLRSQIEFNGEKITNPTWDFFKEMGLEVTDLEAVKEANTISELGEIEEDIRVRNREIIDQNFGIETGAKELIQVLGDIRSLYKKQLA